MLIVLLHVSTCSVAADVLQAHKVQSSTAVVQSADVPNQLSLQAQMSTSSSVLDDQKSLSINLTLDNVKEDAIEELVLFAQ